METVIKLSGGNFGGYSVDTVKMEATIQIEEETITLPVKKLKEGTSTILSVNGWKYNPDLSAIQGQAEYCGME